jgi:hypothetical protein
MSMEAAADSSSRKSTNHGGTPISHRVVSWFVDHGDIAGRDVANPVSMILSSALMLRHIGEFEAAAKYHKENIEALSEHARAGRAIVGTSTSCTLTLKEEAPELLDAFDPDSDLVAAHTFDFNEFVLGLATEGRIPELEPVEMRVPYHQPCQYRAHQLGSPSRDVMELIPGVQVAESGAACCGIAGTYGYKVEKYQIAMDVGRPLFDFVKEEDQLMAACDSETCRWQITHATGVTIRFRNPSKISPMAFTPVRNAFGRCSCIQSATFWRVLPFRSSQMSEMSSLRSPHQPVTRSHRTAYGN